MKSKQTAEIAFLLTNHFEENRTMEAYLNEFDIKINNIRGVENNIADSLSRCYLVNEQEKGELFNEDINI